MLRLATNLACRLSSTLVRANQQCLQRQEVIPRAFSSLPGLSLSCNPGILAIGQAITAPQTRSLTKFSMQSGKRKSVKAVLKRFYRLDWGEWIRTRTGRHKHLWRKSAKAKRRLRQHVFVNSTQAYLLDKMVTKFWRMPKFYVNDPYRPYHSREEFYQTKKRTDQC
ncbi:large ribosomal subunit protein bL35m [Phlebotomus argentipes]|uniref:large ribosomal subunit protein bL35m n=1 Tax=Phlebotomus argentipes TaxID=94469 RepID=UPI0028929C13|nr:large ribosomal subunit protein bL35m [Phlebotomus argentipes]